MVEDDPAARDGVPTLALLAEMGEQVRAMRKDANLTLEQLSEIAGLSTGSISQIERGLANPSVGTLAQLAYGLGVSVARLFQTSDQRPAPVVRRSARRRLRGYCLGDEGSSSHELLTPDLDSAMEATWVRTPPGHDSSVRPYRHRGEELGLVVSGHKDVYLDGHRYELGPGDSIRYCSMIPHWYVNPGDESCTALWVAMSPSQ
ncbi:helix-turn-helix domain-containing protein [Pseudonocardia spinosispora]|uniref:helix-turn-helix domain-containing protein n=1 Tax=Pseudonocardia spinosispora TaxID=103441 RepID=UPI0004196958|nr:XRE family transcriptional regulator [Pseudonocardia spinosispora]